MKAKRVQLFLIGGGSIITALALFALSAFISVQAALLALCALLWLAVAWASFILRRVRATAEARVVEVHTSYDPIIRTLTCALGLQESINVEQAQRVADIAAALGRHMNLRKEQIRLVEKAAILHDIGKMGVAQDVLTRQGELSDDDWAELKRHAEQGYQIFSRIESLNDIAEIIQAHHERFDGQGYPNALAGEDIPLGARIYAVADSYAAMTSDRPYRKKISHEMALKEIVRNSLTQFDPNVVRAFLEADEHGLFVGKLRGESSRNGADLPLPSEAFP